MPFKKGQSGNPAGRKKGTLTEVGKLREAIKAVEKKKRKKFLTMIVEKAYEDSTMAKAVLGKLVPDLKHLEGDVKHDLTGLMDLAAQVHQKRKPKRVKSS